MPVRIKRHLSRLSALSVLLLCIASTATLRAQGVAAPDQTVVVLLDDSGSMDERMRGQAERIERMDAAKDALVSVLSQLPPTTRVGVLTLNSQRGGSNWVVPLGPLAADNWRSQVEALEAGGGTPLGEFLKAGADALLAARAARPYGTYRLLIVTDGEANDPMLVDSYLPEILARGLMVDVIGVDMDGEHSLARRAHSYRRADDATALQRALAEVFAEASPDDAALEADFELLAGLPDEFAAEAVKVLTQRNDEPIAGIEMDEQAWLEANPNQAAPATTVDLLVSGLLCCMCPLVLMTLTVVGFLMVIRKRR
jgi:hypothetical protein